MKGVDQGWIGVINFTVTKSGLENKLLSIIINREKPDIEEKKSKCL
jgi:dynein heavy chain 2